MTILIIASVCVAAYCYIKYVYLFNKKLDRFATPPYYPILGHALDFTTKDHLGVLTKYIDEYGETVRIKVGPKRTLLLTAEYKLLEFILTSTKVLEKSVDYRNLSRWLGTGLLTSGGDKWKRNRLILTPTFHFQILEQFVDVFEDNGKILVEKFQQYLGSNSFDIYPLITLCTLDIICETAMGTSVHAQDNRESEYVQSVKDMCEIVVERAFSFYKMFDSLYFFTQDYRREKRALKILHSYTNEVIAMRQEAIQADPQQFEGRRKKAFLDHLLLANDGKLTLDEIRQEVDTFMFAGHDTTASAISFTLFCLANNAEIQNKVINEQRKVLGNNFSEPITYDVLKRMKYLEMVIKESMRLYPPVPFYARELENDTLYDGGYLPKGLTITMFVFGIHRNSKYFPYPERFDPDRFKSSEGRLPFAFLPFSAGPRNCIGQKFAMAEMKSVISRVIRSFVLLPSLPNHQLRLASNTVLMSTNGIHIRVRTRSNVEQHEEENYF